MSSTPPKKGEENEVVQSTPEEPDPHMDTQGQEQGHEVEVKEQDRWLPIANGKSSSPRFPSSRAYLRGAVTGGRFYHPTTSRITSALPNPYLACTYSYPFSTETVGVQQQASCHLHHLHYPLLNLPATSP